MIDFKQKEFNQFILDQGIIGLFPKAIKLSSGRYSSWYVNWRNVSNDVFLIDQLCDYLLAFLQKNKIEFDCLYGTPDGATKLAIVSQYKWAKSQKNFSAGEHILAMGRKTPKDHGEAKDRFFVGAPAGKVVILEDVTTTGGSLLKAVKTLLDQGIEIVAAVALTNRNENMDDGKHVSEALDDLGVKYLAMSNATELLPEMLGRYKKSILEEFEKYGETKIVIE